MERSTALSWVPGKAAVKQSSSLDAESAYTHPELNRSVLSFHNFFDKHHEEILLNTYSSSTNTLQGNIKEIGRKPTGLKT